MGATDAYHFAAGHKFQLKWFREGEHFKTITANTQADLQPMTTQDPGLKALRARRNSGRPNEYVWIEYRQPVSFDARMSPNGWRGALLHIEAAESGRYAEAIDVTPSCECAAARS